MKTISVILIIILHFCTPVIALAPRFSNSAYMRMPVPSSIITITPVQPTLNPTPCAIKENSKIINTVNENDLYWLAKIIHAEAEAESIDGQIAVGNVVMNRVSHSKYPKTIKGVIYHRVHGMYQFSSVEDGRLDLEPDKKSYDSAMRVLMGTVVVPKSVIFFYNPDYTPKHEWIRTRPIVKTIGNHVFCT